MIDYVAIHRDTALTTLFPADASHSEEYRITHAAGIAAVVAAAKREAATVASETFDGLGIAPEASIRDWIRRAIVAEATQ